MPNPILGLVLVPQSFTVPPAANAAALDTAITAQMNVLSKLQVNLNGGTPVAGSVQQGTIQISEYTCIIDSTDVVTFTAMITWMGYIQQS
jgi:hypothetical protein